MRLTIIIFISLICSLVKAQSIPDLNLTDKDGKKTTLQKKLGDEQITVISFWATWCKPCLSELRAYSNRYEDWKNQFDLKIYTISVDDPALEDRAKTYSTSRGWTFEWYYDRNQKAVEVFAFDSLPRTYVYDAQDNLIYTSDRFLAGDEKKLEDAVRKHLNP